MIYIVYDREKHKDIVKLEDLNLCEKLCEVLNAICIEKLEKKNIVVMLPFKRFVVIREDGGCPPVYDFMKELTKMGFRREKHKDNNNLIFDT